MKKVNSLKNTFIVINKLTFFLIVKPIIIFKKHKILIFPLLISGLAIITLLEIYYEYFTSFLKYLFLLNTEKYHLSATSFISLSIFTCLYISVLIFFNYVFKIKPNDVSKENIILNNKSLEIKNIDKKNRVNINDIPHVINFNKVSYSQFNEVTNDHRHNEKTNIENNYNHTSFINTNNNHNLEEINNTYNSFYEKKEKTINKEILSFEIRSKIIEQTANKFQYFFKKTNSREEDFINLLLNKNEIKNGLKLYVSEKWFCFILFKLCKNNIFGDNARTAEEEALDIYKFVMIDNSKKENLTKYFSEFKQKDFLRNQKKGNYNKFNSTLELIIRNNIKSVKN
ncbi:hypothetical protein FHR24_002134 [Wenyingzhuangia heitensis]|uniref:Phage abortive infection protein n=1 Tax=Wenyingzhuangia heitensis TaxID=1487859 RepID=A0ABX0UDR8_9FLAO|nr:MULTISPECIES: hypothetical protein [Wenyingzhuangia]NIJ45666.1 hypothetical protein [Wenyingzhuangia heitensis]NJB84134.1 hypothetical protein [Wenyingzhuangia aestuarii]